MKVARANGYARILNEAGAAKYMAKSKDNAAMRKRVKEAHAANAKLRAAKD
jgi:hypothetical protein